MTVALGFGFDISAAGSMPSDGGVVAVDETLRSRAFGPGCTAEEDLPGSAAAAGSGGGAMPDVEELAAAPGSIRGNGSGDDDMAARLGCSLAGGVPVVAEAPGSGGRAGEVEVPAGLCALAFSLRPFLALATLSSARTSAPVSAFGWPDWLLDLAWSCAMKRLISRTQRAARPPGI